MSAHALPYGTHFDDVMVIIGKSLICFYLHKMYTDLCTGILHRLRKGAFTTFVHLWAAAHVHNYRNNGHGHYSTKERVRIR